MLFEDARLSVGVLILARDEEANLPDCLHSVRGWAEQVVVVIDSRTRDRSREIAREWGAEVVEHDFDYFAAQKNWALDHIEWRTPWILVVDADERVPPDFREELRSIVNAPDPAEGYCLRKKFIFYGRWIRHCWYSSWDLRLFKTGKARYEAREVHEHMIADGRVGYFSAGLVHNDFRDLDAWISKHNRYATLEADEIVQAKGGSHLEGRLSGSRLERRRFLKTRIWNRVPFRPLWMFLYLYFAKLGILDGRLGLRFCLWHAVFDAFITGKAWERRLMASNPPPNYYRELLRAHLVTHPEDRKFYQER
jgi:glycosyltransferase involved in cell wall biosynthesis